MELVLFDLDNTLLAGDSDYGWAQFLIEQKILDRGEYEARNERFYAQYNDGSLDIGEFLAYQLEPLARYPREQLNAWHAQFMRRKVLPMITAKARALIAQHQARTALLAIVTATNRFVTTPIAAELGIEHLIATEAEEIDGEFTGRHVGIPCFREGKVARVDEFLSARGRGWESFARSYFYSDSLNDLPLLGKVTHPVAVDPDPTLKAHAAARGWPVISLR